MLHNTERIHTQISIAESTLLTSVYFHYVSDTATHKGVFLKIHVKEGLKNCAFWEILLHVIIVTIIISISKCLLCIRCLRYLILFGFNNLSVRQILSSLFLDEEAMAKRHFQGFRASVNMEFKLIFLCQVQDPLLFTLSLPSTSLHISIGNLSLSSPSLNSE